MVVIIKLENSTYFMTATVAPVCYGFMFQSVVAVVVVVFFGLCVVGESYLHHDRCNNLLCFYVSE